MAKVVYVGPLDEVSVPALGLGRVTVGAPVEVPDEAADRLLEQADAWALEGSEAALAAAKRVSAGAAPKGKSA
jgi:hypothetical protein